MHKRITAKELKDGNVIVEMNAYGERSCQISELSRSSEFTTFTVDVGGNVLRDRLRNDATLVIDVPDDHPITLTDEDEVQLHRLLGSVIERAWSLRATIGNAGVLEPIEVDENSDVWDDVSVIGASISEINTTFFGRGGPLS